MLEVLIFLVLGILVMMLAGYLFHVAYEDFDSSDFESAYASVGVFMCAVLILLMSVPLFAHAKALFFA